jgi:S1-C subfamily serine protease
MSDQPEPGAGPRRAVDGLDWSRAPEETDAGVEPVSEPPPPVRAERRPRLVLFVLLALVAGLAGGAAAGGTAALLLRDGGAQAAPAQTPGSSIAVELTGAIADAAKKARPSVVRIDSTRRVSSGIERDTGSGVILDNEGHILTNAHVVLGTDSVKVILSDGSERQAILVGHDSPFTDLAVLQVSPGKLQPIDQGDSAALSLGETVIAIGNPLAEFDGSVSVGVVSGINRRRVFDAVRQDDLIQTDAAVNNGNSGGALVNLKGQFVGMPTAILRQSRGGQVVEGIAFALPSARIMEIAKGIITAGGNYPRPTMGIEHTDLNPDNPPRLVRLAVDEGAFVNQVTAGGPAAAGGVAAGDVITRVGDFQVDANNPFFNGLAHYAPGETVRVVLNRSGRIIEIEVRLAKRS